MDISVRTVSNGIESTNQENWVRVEGRPADDSVGLIVGTEQIGHTPGHCYHLYFPGTGEVARYASAKTKAAPAPAPA